MGILQARILEWVAICFSRESSQPKDQTQVSHIAGGFFTIWTTREAAVNVGIFVWTSAFNSFRYIPRSGIAGSYSNSRLILWWTAELFPQQLYCFALPLAKHKGSSISTSLPIFFFFLSSFLFPFLPSSFLPSFPFSLFLSYSHPNKNEVVFAFCLLHNLSLCHIVCHCVCLVVSHWNYSY